MLIERDANHKYTIDDQPVPGVSEILQGVGYVDSRHFNAESRRRGTHVHIVTAAWDRGDLVMGQVHRLGLDYTLPYLEAWKKFRNDTGFVPTEIECVVGHPTLMYAGTLDRLGDWDGERVLVDIKTGGPEPCHGVQTKAYAEPVSPLLPRFGVYLSDDGKYKVHEYRLWDDWDAFVAALSVWKWKERHGLNRRDN